MKNCLFPNGQVPGGHGSPRGRALSQYNDGRGEDFREFITHLRSCVQRGLVNDSGYFESV